MLLKKLVADEKMSKTVRLCGFMAILFMAYLIFSTGLSPMEPGWVWDEEVLANITHQIKIKYDRREAAIKEVCGRDKRTE